MTTLGDLEGRATITAEEAASLLHCGRATVYEAIRTGELPSLRLGRRVFLPVPRLLAILGASPDEAAL